MLTGVAMWFSSEARKGLELTRALWPWGWRGQGCRAPGGGVARPHSLEHDTQPYEYDQRELVEEQRRYHGKTPSYTGCNEGIVPGLQVAGLSRRREGTTHHREKLQPAPIN